MASKSENRNRKPATPGKHAKTSASQRKQVDSTGSKPFAVPEVDRRPSMSLTFQYRSLLEPNDERSSHFQHLSIELSATVDLEFAWSVPTLRLLEQKATTCSLVLASYNISVSDQHPSEILTCETILNKLVESCVTVGDKAWLEVRFPSTFVQTNRGVETISSLSWVEITDMPSDACSLSAGTSTVSTPGAAPPSASTETCSSAPSKSKSKAWNFKLDRAKSMASDVSG
jgi:hypothetical protein